MTAEERARRVYERLFRVGVHLHAPVPMDPMADLTEALTAAETDAYNRAVEECARVADYYAGLPGTGNNEIAARFTGRQVATAIRALRKPGPTA